MSGRSITVFLLLGLLMVGEPGAAENETAETTEPEPRDDDRPRRKRFGNGLRNVREDGIHLITFPKRRTRKGVIASAAVGAGIVALVFADDEIREEVQEARSPSLDRWEDRIEPLGHSRNTTLAALATYGFGRILRHERTTETGRALIESLLFTQAFTSATKGLFGRDPPGGDNDAGDFFEGGAYFPSGHTSRAFAIATVLAERHGRVAAWIGYPLATAVGLARLENDSHWASDVLAGAALGHVIAKSVVRRRGARSRRVREARAAPMIGPVRGGAVVTFSISLD